MKLRNARIGNQRIAEQISHAFAVQIDKDVVRRVLATHYGPDHPGASGPSWLTFLAQAKDSLWSVDLFRCESLLLRSHSVLVVIDVFTRRIVGFGIGGEYIDGPAVCRMFNQAIAGHVPPARISTDHDPLFCFHRWLANLRILEVEEIKSVPYAPMSHPFIERLIGTIRREYLDHTFFWNSIDLRRKLENFRAHYGGARVHRSLNGTTRESRRKRLICESEPGSLCLGTALQWAIRHSRRRLTGNSPPTGSEFASDQVIFAPIHAPPTFGRYKHSSKNLRYVALPKFSEYCL